MNIFWCYCVVVLLVSLFVQFASVACCFMVLLFGATLDVPKSKSGGLVKKVGPFSKRKHPL